MQYGLTTELSFAIIFQYDTLGIIVGKAGTLPRRRQRKDCIKPAMKYIVLDLEWNQAYQEKAMAVQRQLETRLRGEVIQIGAVMLNE